MPIQIKERVMYDITDLDIADIKLIYAALEGHDCESDAETDQRDALLDGLRSLVED